MSPQQNTLDLFSDGAATTGAVFNDDRTHRSKLWRRWAPDDPMVLWVMLNPSIADEHRLDPTLRKCMGFAKQWGYGGMWIGNLYTLVSPYPADLVDRDPAELNTHDADRALLDMAAEADRIVLGWGHQPFLTERAHHVARLLALERNLPLYCLGTTKDGWPRHPLYRGYEAALEPWVGARP